MANVNIKFNGKEFLLSCDDGQEAHLEELSEQLDKLKELGINKVWITHKHPLLVFLLPALLPLFLFGDLITIAMVKFGIA